MMLPGFLRRWWRAHEATPSPVPGLAPPDPAANQTAATLCIRGAERFAAGDLAGALACYEEAVALRHDFASAHHQLGRICGLQDRVEDALDSLQLAVHFAPDSAEIHTDLAAMLLRCGQLDEAREVIAAALELDARHALAHFTAAGIEKAHGRRENALAAYRAALDTNPAFAEAWCNLGLVLLEAGKVEEARVGLQRAIELRPDMVEAVHNYGLLLLEDGAAQQALDHFNRALALRPDAPEIQSCRAHALRELGRFDDALKAYDGVLAAHPRFGDAVNNRATLQLLRGDYAQGWNGYRQRLAATHTAERGFPYPEWDGTPLAGRTLLVYAEQALGDEILFASCIPDVLNTAHHCVLECSPRLANLYRDSFSAATIHGGRKSDGKEWLAGMPRIDCQTSVASLPLYLRRRAADFPAQPYLCPDAGRVAAWRDRLDRLGTAPKIGISWRGGSRKTRAATRSTALDAWLPVLSAAPACFVSLQYGAVTQELARLEALHGIRITHWQDAIDDYDETAALLSALDLVISVTTAVVHLGGALGCPVWVLAPQVPEWCFGDAGPRMPWYGSVRMFRQQNAGDWGPVFSEVAKSMPAALARGPGL